MKILKKTGLFFSILTLYTCTAFCQWTQVNYDTNLVFSSVEFLSGQVGYASGDSGIFKTVDGGTNWSIINSTIPSSRLYFINPDTGFGFAMNNYLLMTMNGGNTWQDISFNNVQLYANIEFGENCNGYISAYIQGGGTALFKSTDCGQGWNKVYQDSNSNNPLATFSFVNANYGFALSRGLSHLYRTSNGGNNWQLINNQVPFGPTQLSGFIFIDSTTGFSGGWYNPLYKKSVDGGYTWTSLKVATNGHMPNVGGMAIKDSVIYTISAGGQFVYKSDNLGQTWITQSVQQALSENIYFDIDIVDPNVVFIIGKSDGSIFRTTNGGGIGEGLKENNNLKKKIKVFPNPAKGTISIETKVHLNFTSLILMDNQGEKAREYKKDERELNINGLSSGIYFLQLQTEKGKITEKIVVQ